jgi:ABC-2 type transport system permease protein
MVESPPASSAHRPPKGGRPGIGAAVTLWWVFFRVGAMNELQYRVNFFIELLQSLFALATGLVALSLVFAHTHELAGWTRPELLAVMGVHIMMGGLIQTFVEPNMDRLAQVVQQGTLDYALTKPQDSQVVVSVREVRIWQGVNVLMGLIVLGVAIDQAHAGIGVWQALAFAAALVLGGVMIYCFWLIITTGAFWIVRMEEISELFQGVYQAGRWPVSVYPIGLRAGLTFLVPVAFAVTVPASALTHRLTGHILLLAFGFAVSLLVLTRWFWRLGLRHYSGASA